MNFDLHLKQKYVRAYENWYCVSCNKHNEEPVSFNVYFSRVPLSLVIKINEELDKGNIPS